MRLLASIARLRHDCFLEYVQPAWWVEAARAARCLRVSSLLSLATHGALLCIAAVPTYDGSGHALIGRATRPFGRGRNGRSCRMALQFCTGSGHHTAA